MKLRFNSAVKMLALAAAMAVASSASAQSAGQWTAMLGANKITPQVTSGDVSPPALPGTKGDVGPDTQPILMFTYSFTDNISTQFGLGTPYKHAIYGTGAIEGVGKIGSIEVLPPTVFIQYRLFQPTTMFRPYVGLGLTYAHFMKATGSGQFTAITNTGGEPSTFENDNKVTGTVQAGLTMNINERWFADVAVTKTKLKTTVHYSTGQTQEMRLDPVGVSLGIGYKF